MGCSSFHSPDLGRSFLVPIGSLSHYGQTSVLCHTKFAEDRDLEVICPAIFGSSFGPVRVEVILNSARSSRTGFIGWPSALSTRHFIRSVCALCSYPELLFVQYAIMGQLKDQGLFNLRCALSS